eukprot:10191381-Lingulodinium_polyedra.AAC.1
MKVNLELVVIAWCGVLLSCPMLERYRFVIAACPVRLCPPWYGVERLGAASGLLSLRFGSPMDLLGQGG